MIFATERSLRYGLSRKYICFPEIGLVTKFWPLTVTGVVKMLLQTVEEFKFVVDCNVERIEFVGHEMTTL